MGSFEIENWNSSLEIEFSAINDRIVDESCGISLSIVYNNVEDRTRNTFTRAYSNYTDSFSSRRDLYFHQ